MEPIAMLSADPLDILFENRNKDYGAYTLRKYYAQRLYISMGVTLSIVVLISFACYYFQSPAALVRTYVLPDLIPEAYTQHPGEKIIIPPARPAAPRPPAAIQNTIPVIVADLKDPKPLPDLDQLKTNAIGTLTTNGDPDNGESQLNGNGVARSDTKTKDSVEKMEKIYTWTEVMPEFPGGIEALKRFLLKNLRMPDNNLETGTQVRVVTRFVVDAGGKVSDIEITQPADPVFNAEVKRVISKMPDWKPGIQNHHPVSVYFSLPVNFVTSD